MTYNPDWGAGGGGALELVETKVVTVATTSLTFSGLDGNTDGAYKMVWSVKQNGVANPALFDLRPNGITANQETVRNEYSGLGEAFGTTTTLEAFRIKIDGGVSVGELLLNAKLEATALKRMGTSFAASTNSSGDLEAQLNAFEWVETTTNITSLDLVCDLANGIGVGSVVSLYKISR